MCRLVGIFIAIILLQSCCHETVRLGDYEVQGIDISHYQSHIDWDCVADEGFDFVFMKSTEGAYFADSLYCRNWEEVRRVGLKRGAYHFFRPTISADLQAENFIEMVEMVPGDLPPVLDVEVTDGVSHNELIQSIRIWMEKVESHYGIRPILYSNFKFYHKHLAGHFSDCNLWLARYCSVEQPHAESGKFWHFWQYGNKGKLSCIDGDVDFNVFHGSRQDLESMCLPMINELSMRGY